VIGHVKSAHFAPPTLLVVQTPFYVLLMVYSR